MSAISHADASGRFSDILQRFSDIKKVQSGFPAFKKMERLIDSIFNAGRPCDRLPLSIPELRRLLIGKTNGVTTYLKDGAAAELTELFQALELHLRTQGYRGLDALTFQEYRLTPSPDSPFAFDNDRARANPYMPIGLLEGSLTVEEAIRARAVQRCIPVYLSYYDLENAIPRPVPDGIFVLASLEALDTTNQTVHDPRVLHLTDSGSLEVVSGVNPTSRFRFPRSPMEK